MAKRRFPTWVDRCRHFWYGYCDLGERGPCKPRLTKEGLCEVMVWEEWLRRRAEKISESIQRRSLTI